MPRIAFDLDEALGVPVIQGQSVINWQTRPGCVELLDGLRSGFELVLCSFSPRTYVDKALSFGLNRFFTESYSWDEMPAPWKDVRRMRADYLVDDSPHHREAAMRYGMADSYIVVPAYGSPDDVANPLGWVRSICASLEFGT